MQQPKAWERQPGETPQAWEARRKYIHMAPPRSYKRVSEELGKSEGLVGRWSRRWNWVKSAAAYDGYVEDIAVREKVESDAARLRAEIEQWSERDDRYADQLYNVFIIAYNGLIEAQVAAKKGGKSIPPRLLSVLIRAIVRAMPSAERSLELARARKSSGGAGASLAPLGGKAKAALQAYEAAAAGPTDANP